MYRDPRLAGSWEGLLQRLTADGTTERWAALEPALGEPVDLAVIATELWPGVAPDRADELLGALVRLAAADGPDDPDAVLVLLHLLSDGATALAHRIADLSGDSLPLVVGQLTVQIRAFPGADAAARTPRTCCSTPGPRCSASCCRTRPAPGPRRGRSWSTRPTRARSSC